MNEPISVEARFAKDGKIRPMGFEWKGLHYFVESTGRQWQADGILHILVMAIDAKVFELTFDPSNLNWHLVRTPRNFGKHDSI